MGDPRKVGRLITIRTASGTLRPARITAVGAGTNVNGTVKGAESYINLPRWSRSAPATPGWIR
jgi:hypothetical protein